MPQVKWIKPEKPVNHLRALFSAYRSANGLTSENVAAKLGCTPENVRSQWCKPTKSWKIGDLLRYCDAMGIPVAEALEAAAK